MEMLAFAILTCYFLVMPILFLKWLGFFMQDQNMSKTERKLSWAVLTIATLFWPLTLPLAYLELLDKVKRYERRAKMVGVSLKTLSDPTF
ncbi:hypothetical protein [Alkalinema sp. FACHB-956]|uniref:hypothetical protein n=1 Tax=Alkalinema sp. FACHB-956 TaxID=2692768 RepID=UPI001686D463|nr:hypothetical protein [Alkalinema sp. FACHB-956]MBD2328751.1 hypothetical protein [Alkalinema sp. FACHB-956]